VVEGEAPLPRNLPPYVHGLFATGPTEGWSAPAGTVATDFASSNPTVVNNVETLATASLVLARGPEWHRSLGTERSPGVVIATVVGDVVRPGVGEVELGTPLREVIDQVGGGVASGRTVKAVLSGVSNPVVTADQLDVPCSYEGMEAIGNGMGAAGFMVFDDTTSMVEVAQMISRFLYVESCGQCPACKLGCGAITERLDALAAGSANTEDLDVVAFRLGTVTAATCRSRSGGWCRACCRRSPTRWPRLWPATPSRGVICCSRRSSTWSTARPFSMIANF
jgi:NADH-quinone oxidoreductase subunit F